MTEADRVKSPEMMRYARTTWLGVVAAVLAVPVDAIRLMLDALEVVPAEPREVDAPPGVAA
jgi:hypothetical protein